MNKVITKIILIGMLLVLPCICFAQSASESYNKGLSLMKKGEYTEAIACFKASMAINKSAANVKKCRAQINRCTTLSKNVKVPEVVKTMNVEKADLTFPPNGESTASVKVTITPEDGVWTAAIVSPGGEKWCSLSKSMDGKELLVTCSPSTSTVLRETRVNVVYESLVHSIKIMQQGYKVQLYTDTPFLTFGKRKGGTQTTSVTCNSDTLYADKKNWTVENAPEWCDVKALGNQLSVTVNKLTKENPEFKMGRTGNIVLRSQNEEWIVRVDQK